VGTLRESVQGGSREQEDLTTHQAIGIFSAAIW